MAENKKSFILYADMISVFKKLIEMDRIDKTNNAGELMFQILQYVNDLNPVPLNMIVDLTFEPIKLQLKRDLKKYEDYRTKQSENGKQGGRPPKPKPFIKNQKTQALIWKAKKA